LHRGVEALEVINRWGLLVKLWYQEVYPQLGTSPAILKLEAFSLATEVA